MSEPRSNKLPSTERLKRKKLIASLFENKESVRIPSFVLAYKFVELSEDVPAQVLFSASKRNFRRAHDRNRIKRLMREAYRKQKHDAHNSLHTFHKQAALMFIFTGRQIPDYAYVHGRMNELLKRFRRIINEQYKDNEPKETQQ